MSDENATTENVSVEVKISGLGSVRIMNWDVQLEDLVFGWRKSGMKAAEYLEQSVRDSVDRHVTSDLLRIARNVSLVRSGRLEIEATKDEVKS